MSTDTRDPGDVAAADGAQDALVTLSQRVGREVGPDDLDRSLADLGLDSLGTLRWRADLERGTGVRLPLVELTGDRTLAAVLDVLAGMDPGPTTAPPASGDDPEPEPAESTQLTPVQQAYWAGRGQDYPGGGVATFWYHEYDRGPEHRRRRALVEDLERLERAWRRVVAHHPMLRTVVDRDGNRHVARHDVRDWQLERIDLRDHPDPEQELRRISAERSHQVLDTTRWPLFDLVAVLLPEDRVRLCAGFDVLVIDFASWGLVLRQWGELVRRPRTVLTAPGTTFDRVLVDRAQDPGRRRTRARDRRWWAGQELPPPPALAPAGEWSHPRRFVRHQHRLDAATWARVVEQAAAHGTSPTSVVLTAFALACSRRSRPVEGAAGLTLTLTLFDRPLEEEAADVVGDFSSTALLPLAPGCGFDPQSPADFAALATAVNRRLWEVLDHRSWSGVEVARERPREGGWPVVFTSGLGQDAAVQDGWLGGRVAGVSQTPQVVWDHLVWEEHGELVLTHDVVADAVGSAEAEGLVAMQRSLLVGLADPGDWSRRAPGWDPAAAPAPEVVAPPGAGPLLHDLWLASLERPGTSTRAAVLGDGVRLEHGELHQRAQALAGRLRGYGVGAGDLVMLALPRGPEQVVAVLATELAGAGYVPVDPAWPPRRLATVQRKTGLRVAVVAAAGAAGLPPGVEAVVVGGPQPASDATPVPAADEAVRPAPDDLAYVIFTSGSTGEPKGVAIEHRQARTTVDDVDERFAVTAEDAVLAVSALSFDLSVHDIFGTLGAGGAVVLPDADRHRDPEHWLQLVAEHEVSVWNSAPPLLEMLVEYAEADPEAASAALRHLRVCLLSGDWIPVTLPDRLRRLAPQVAVHSLGGATEAAIWSITHPVGEVDPTWASIPYGRALRGQSFWVLDEHGAPCHLGQDGELWIGGAGVARGYIGDPQLTAERFVEHPGLGERLYRTGDLGRWRPAGTIEFLGRVDRQVKVGGHRIELGEVEAALLRLPEVRQAVVSSLPGPDGRPRLVAHVSLRGGERSAPPDPETERDTTAELGRRLAAEVPAYMVPHRIMLLASLPMSANGKVDHARLPRPWPQRPAPAPAQAGAPAAPDPSASGPEPVLLVAAEDGPSPSSPRTEPAGTGVGTGATASGVATGTTATGMGTGPTDTQVASGDLRERVLDLLGPGTDPGLPLSANGVSSLQLVRLANLVQDAGHPRPGIADLLRAGSVEELVQRWSTPVGEEPAHDRPGAPPASPTARTSRPVEPEPADPPTEPLPVHATAVLPAEGAATSPAPLPPPGEEGMAADLLDRRWPTRLRRLADLLDAVAEEVHTLRPLLAAVEGADPVTSTGPRRETPAGSRAEAPAGTGPAGTGPAGSGRAWTGGAEGFELTEMQLAYLVGRVPDRAGRQVAPHFYTEALVRDLDPDRLRTAWSTVLARHPMLRAVVTGDGRQRVLAPERVPATVEVADLSDVDPAGQQQERERIRAERSHRVADPSRAPMAWLLAVRLSEGDWRLHLDLDLLCCDATSAVTWVGELAAEYHRPGGLPPAPPARFETWAGTVRASDRAGDHWEQQLATLPDGPRLPLLAPGGAPAWVRRRRRWSAGSWRDLRREAARQGVTATCLLLDRLAAVLPGADGRRGGAATVLLTLSQRPAEHAGVVGDYTATMLLGLEPGASAPERLADLQQRLADGLDHALPSDGWHGNAVLRRARALGRPLTVPVVVSAALDQSDLDGSQLLDTLGRTEYAISQTPQVLLDVQLFDVGGELVLNLDADESQLPGTWLDATFAAFCGELDALAGTPVTTTAGTAPAAAERVRADVQEVFGALLEGQQLEGRRSWFDQGATSLTLVSAQRRLRDRGYDVDVVDLFAHPTPVDTVAHLLSRISPPPAAPTAPTPPTGAPHPVGSAPGVVTDTMARAHLRGARRRGAVRAPR